MPNNSLPVPHYKQNHDGACLPACARMVLKHLGFDVPQARLARLLGTRAFGTPARHVTRLESLGVQVTVGPYSEASLRRWLHQNVPPIVFLQTDALTYWETTTYHAVVLVGMDENRVYLNDPAVDTAPQNTDIPSFLLAWSEFDNLAAIITRTTVAR